jgi:ribosomal protein S18 acetylase RimI-like enzyme
MGEFSVRLANLADVEAIKHVGQSTWPATYEFAGEDYIAHGLEQWWSDDAVMRGIQTTRTLVVEHNGAVVGMGNLDLRREQPIIWKLYVLSEHHGSGAGHALMEALLDQAPSDTDAVLLEYTHGNERAATFYRRHGFTELRRDQPKQPDWPEQVWMSRPMN